MGRNEGSLQFEYNASYQFW